jgi:hypothetical protein
MRGLPLTWRLQRFELVVLLGGCLALASVMAVIAWQLGATQTALEACYRDAPDSAVTGWPCRAFDERAAQLSSIVTVLTGIGTVVPFLVGIFLGAPLVAREIERGTAALAWSLSPFRSTWLIGRVLPVIVLVALALVVLGQAAEAALLAAPPGEIDFRHFAMHGPLLAIRGLAVYAIGLAIGAVLGRPLPAILAAGAVTVAVLVGLHLVRYGQMRAEAVWVDPSASAGWLSYVHESGFRFDDSGELMGFDEAFERFPEVFADEQGDQIPPGTTMVFRVNPPSQYAGFVLGEGVALATIAVAATGLSLAVVRVRRPA